MYFGGPDDLTDDVMSPEVRDLADRMLPGNREQMAELGAKAAAAMKEFTTTLQGVVDAMADFGAALVASDAFKALARALAPTRRRPIRDRFARSQTVRVIDRKGRAHWRPLRTASP
jgi:uncharacterized protein YaaN involved in tellurite resistance